MEVTTDGNPPTIVSWDYMGGKELVFLRKFDRMFRISYLFNESKVKFYVGQNMDELKDIV